MDWRQCCLLLFIFTSIYVGAWRSPREEKRDIRDRRGVHYHTKRHMLASPSEPKRRTSTPPRNRDIRKKPSGHLTPLQEDDMDNDEIVSVAIGPPPIRPKYEKIHFKQPLNPTPANSTVSNFNATDFIKDILSQLGRELLTREVSEDFVFGQYVGTAMKNLTSDLRLGMQHEVVELIVKYQKKNRGETVKTDDKAVNINSIFKDMKLDKKSGNETDDTWPDFTNLAKIVG